MPLRDAPIFERQLEKMRGFSGLSFLEFSDGHGGQRLQKEATASTGF